MRSAIGRGCRTSRFVNVELTPGGCHVAAPRQVRLPCNVPRPAGTGAARTRAPGLPDSSEASSGNGRARAQTLAGRCRARPRSSVPAAGSRQAPPRRCLRSPDVSRHPQQGGSTRSTGTIASWPSSRAVRVPLDVRSETRRRPVETRTGAGPPPHDQTRRRSNYLLLATRRMRVPTVAIRLADPPALVFDGMLSVSLLRNGSACSLRRRLLAMDAYRATPRLDGPTLASRNCVDGLSRARAMLYLASGLGVARC